MAQLKEKKEKEKEILSTSSTKSLSLASWSTMFNPCRPIENKPTDGANLHQ
jgi:hypothetical protein